MGSLPEAYEKAQAALSMRQKVLSSDHPDLAHSLTGEPYMRSASVWTEAQKAVFHSAASCKSCSPAFSPPSLVLSNATVVVADVCTCNLHPHTVV
jgi:hypothetical protein